MFIPTQLSVVACDPISRKPGACSAAQTAIAGSLCLDESQCMPENGYVLRLSQQGLTNELLDGCLHEQNIVTFGTMPGIG